MNCAASGGRLVVLVDEAMYLASGSLQTMLELAAVRSPGDGVLQFVLASVDPLLDRISAAHPGTLPGLVRELEIDPTGSAQVETYIQTSYRRRAWSRTSSPRRRFMLLRCDHTAWFV